MDGDVQWEFLKSPSNALAQLKVEYTRFLQVFFAKLDIPFPQVLSTFPNWPSMEVRSDNLHVS